MTNAAIPAALDPFPEIWCMDFEYIARPGDRPAPICCVALELRSGRELRRWGDELAEPLPIAPEVVRELEAIATRCARTYGLAKLPRRTAL